MILYTAREMNKLDFGSGHNPKEGYKTCDIHGYVDYYFDNIEYKIITDDNVFDEIRCHNVIHHIQDLRKLSKEFNRVIRPGGTLEITESTRECYKMNYYLDFLWYRFIIPRHDIWFSPKYRDCREYFTEFKLVKYEVNKEKELFVFSK